MKLALKIALVLVGIVLTIWCIKHRDDFGPGSPIGIIHGRHNQK